MAKVHPETFRKAALRASSSRLGARITLAALLMCLNFDNMTARASRDTLLDLTGLTEKALKTALQTLRREGEIHAIAYANGGRGRSPVYSFPKAWELLKTGEEDTPVKRGEEDAPVSDKGGNLTSKTGEEDTPPSLYQDKRGGAGRAASGIKGKNGNVWTSILNRLEFAENEKRLWLGQLKEPEQVGCVVRFEAPSKFHADYVNRTHTEKILAAYRAIDADISRIEIIH